MAKQGFYVRGLIAGVGLVVGLAFAVKAEAGPTQPSNVDASIDLGFNGYQPPGDPTGTDYCGEGSGSTLSTTTCINLAGAAAPSTGVFLTSPYTPAGGVSNPNTWLQSAGSLNYLTKSSQMTIASTIDLTGVTGSPSTYTVSDFMTFVGSAGTYDFNTTEILKSFSPGSPDTVDITLVGTLVDTSGNYAATSAELLMDLNQVGGGTGGVAGSATFTSPPSVIIPKVPEPASLMLLGSGLIGLGASRLRRRSH